MANTLPPGLQKQINKAVNEHAAASGKPSTEPSASPTTSQTGLKNQPKTITTQPPQISPQELETAHQTAQAEALAAQQVPDKRIFSTLGDQIEYHQLGSQYLLTVKPLPLSIAALLLWVALCIALLSGASWLLTLPSRRKQKPATRVKRLSLFAP